jgi:hypothetical protein
MNETVLAVATTKGLTPSSPLMTPEDCGGRASVNDDPDDQGVTTATRPRSA